MKQLYGEFCSHHTEAVGVFKELKQQNKKLQNFVKVSCCLWRCDSVDNLVTVAVLILGVQRSASSNRAITPWSEGEGFRSLSCW